MCLIYCYIFATSLYGSVDLLQAVEFFVAHPDYSRETKIDALELLGASFANDKDNYDLERCYHYLRLAMKWRYGDPDRVLPKVCCLLNNIVTCNGYYIFLKT